jgi:8-oxo-dGTP pyrophosphatase MutT (NUDIX family)
MTDFPEHHNPWQTRSSKSVYENNWIEVTHRDVTNPNGNEGIYGVVHFKNLAIGIIPLDDDNNTWIVGQYRYPINIYSWEIPEGGGKLGIDPLESAKRELLEECGIVASSWDELLQMYLSNSATDEKAILYVARGLSFTDAAPEDTEQLKLRKLSFAELFDMVMRGEVTDAMTVAGVLKLQHILNR